jgi:hypothetical protein
MAAYSEMKKLDLQDLLRARDLPYSGNKAVLVERLHDSEIFPTSSRPQPRYEDSEPLPENFLEQMKNSDPRVVTNILRKLVHVNNVRAKRKDMMSSSYSRRNGGWAFYDDECGLDKGKCLTRDCPLCGTGDLGVSLSGLLGWRVQCDDSTCQDFNNCSRCRGEVLKLEVTYMQRRERESCVDGFCGNVSKCLRCENHIRDARTPLLRSDGDPGYLRIRMPTIELRKVLTEVKKLMHNEYLDRLFRKLQKEGPSASEWTKIRQELKEGKCLGSSCSSCGSTTVTECLEALSDGVRTDCDGKRPDTGCDIITCSSCHQTIRHMEDDLSVTEKGTCITGLCGRSSGCVKCQNMLRSDPIPSVGPVHHRDGVSVSKKAPEVDSLCFDEDCTGPDTCFYCQYEKEMEKDKRAERALDNKRARRFEQLGQCDGADPTLPFSLGCRFLDCKRCRMIEAKIGPKERNDELRRRRAEEIKTSLSESSDGTMIGLGRKRRFSNLDLNYPLLPDHPLAKRVREEKHREKLERQKAQYRHERPPWFGTPEDPLPDRWMGRPILSEKEINVLKVMDSIPKYYLSHSEEYNIALVTGKETKKFCTIIRRLEAELMSRDFWVQSLGFDADDGFGNFPAGDYWLEDADGTSTGENNTGRVED